MFSFNILFLTVTSSIAGRKDADCETFSTCSIGLNYLLCATDTAHHARLYLTFVFVLLNFCFDFHVHQHAGF